MDIKRIYITRGDNVYSWCNGRQVKNDKALAVEMSSGKLYWLNVSTCHLQCSRHSITGIDDMVYISNEGRAYRQGKQVSPTSYELMPVPVTKLAGHHDDLFSKDSAMMKRAERKDNGGIWFYPSEVKALEGAAV